MKIGIIADSHDNLPKIKKAVEIFNKQNVELVLHAGDFVAPFSLIPLDDLKCEYLGVFGNNDGERNGLTQKAGGRVSEAPRVINRISKTILLAHSLDQISLQNQSVNMVVYGHTHSPLARMDKGVLWLNPGECCGWLTGIASVAVVDLRTLAYQIINL